eukprot:TRINITY_DN7352_c2_g1_i1.p1 TRINITY_DN7352_c2_g1~~TRINITY_DN7352_c2_g1_i1.p1  ORF type:complete len:227 (+),score=39.84 TRINITY_DN7352_c2_g1_i1:33-683(+)
MVMQFEDWLQVFSHTYITRPVGEDWGWSSLRIPGKWTPQTCGGTPIPVKKPVLATPESWAKNPQCRIILGAGAHGESGEVELCVTLQQQDGRMTPGSPWPFEDKLMELFVAAIRLEGPTQQLEAFDKRLIVKSNGVSAVSLLAFRRSVLLRTRLTFPGSYAVTPSTWGPELGRPEAPFLLSLHLRCSPEQFRIIAPTREGWEEPLQVEAGVEISTA